MMRENGATDHRCDARGYRVAAGSNSVHPCGNPISHSWRHGFVREGMYVPRRSAAFLELLPPAFDTPLLRGVGKKSRDPNSISDMGGAKVGSLNAVPDCIIPERGQVTEDASEPCAAGSRKQLWNVLHDRDAGSKLANKSGVLSPQAGAFAINSRSAASLGKVLARETARNDIDGNSIGSKSLCGESADVVIARHLRPMFRQHGAGEFLDFAERDGFEAARSFQPEAEPTNSAEQIQQAKLCRTHYATPPCWTAAGEGA